LIRSEAVLGLPQYELTGIAEERGWLLLSARYSGPIRCPHCGGERLRSKGRYTREVRHESWGERRCRLRLEAHKWACHGCRRQFRQRFPGILPRKQASEPFRHSIFIRHWDGISRCRLAQREGLGSATVERWFQDFLQREESKLKSAACPVMLGIDEHFFSRRHGYATTFCDLKSHRVYDVVLGRSEASLESYLARLPGKERVEMVCIDLSASYRAVVRKHFPQAKIVADRFHVIRLINHHFLTCWRELDPQGARQRGLLSLMRRHQRNLAAVQQERLAAYLAEHPAMAAIYPFKQRLCALLLYKTCNQQQCRKLAPRLLRAICQLRQAGLPQLVNLGETLHAWSHEIAAMWRFTRNNGILEGFHTKMEVLQRQAYGFRNFQNYRLRVKVMCS
jgi:transposase